MGKYHFDSNTDRRGSGSTKWDSTPAGVIPMWCADMDFDVAPPLAEAIQKRAAHPNFGYSVDVVTGLNQKLVNHYRKKFDVEVKPEWIVWVPCVIGGCELAVEMLNGAFLYNTPIYGGQRGVHGSTQLPVVEVPMKVVNNRYVMDEAAMEAAVTPDMTCFLACNPHNPVGVMYDQEELEQLQRFCTRHNLIVISDEIHCEFQLDKRHIPYFAVNETAAAHSITISSAGKACNIPGLPWGFAIIPDEELRRRYREHLRGHEAPVNVITAAAYEKAFDGSCDEWKAELLDYLRANRGYLEQRIAQMDGLSMPHVEGTYLAWIDCSALQVEDICTFFLEKAKVQVINGSAFAPGSKHIRLNFGCPRAQLTEALDRMEEAVRNRLLELAENGR